MQTSSVTATVTPFASSPPDQEARQVATLTIQNSATTRVAFKIKPPTGYHVIPPSGVLLPNQTVTVMVSSCDGVAVTSSTIRTLADQMLIKGTVLGTFNGAELPSDFWWKCDAFFLVKAQYTTANTLDESDSLTIARPIQTMMRAVLIKGFGSADQLFIGNRPVPEVLVGHSLVRVQATALNRADISQREGKYPPPPGASDILGLEMAGYVVSCNGTSPFKTGDRVMGLLSGGGYAEYCVIPTSSLIPIPADISFTDAAAIPEAFMTAYQALFWIGALQPNQKVLIHAGASGVGIAAIQIAKQISQVTVFTTAGSDDKCAFCKSIGADFAINYKTNPDFATYIMEQTENRGVDLIIDFIGRDYFQLNLNSAAVDASIVVLALMSGSVINSPVDISAILRKRVAIKGSTLRARTDDYKARLAREMSSFVMPRVLAGSIKPKVFAKFPLEEVIIAHQMMERNENIGKIVLEIV